MNSQGKYLLQLNKVWKHKQKVENTVTKESEMFRFTQPDRMRGAASTFQCFNDDI